MEETFRFYKDPDDKDVYVEVDIISDAEDAFRVWEDYDGSDIKTFESRDAFWAGLREEGLDDRVDELLQGDLVFVNGKAYAGLERYRHSGDVYAICREGQFCDRRWDVSPIVGWISSHPEMDEDVVSKVLDGTSRDVTPIFKRFRAGIEDFNDAVSGNCWGYRVVLFDDGDEVGDHSCWGFLGDADYCKEEATRVAEYMLKDYKPDYTVCKCCGQRIR